MDLNLVSEDPQPDFVSLAAAAAIVVYSNAASQAGTDLAVLDRIAAAIAKQGIAIYAREGWGNSIDLVRPDVLANAVFQDGGVLMRSRNVTYTDLRMRRRDLPALIKKLSESETTKK